MQRSADELSQLFIKDSVDLSTASSALAREAATMAKMKRASLQGAAGGVTTTRGRDE